MAATDGTAETSAGAAAAAAVAVVVEEDEAMSLSLVVTGAEPSLVLVLSAVSVVVASLLLLLPIGEEEEVPSCVAEVVLAAAVTVERCCCWRTPKDAAVLYVAIDKMKCAFTTCKISKYNKSEFLLHLILYKLKYTWRTSWEEVNSPDFSTDDIMNSSCQNDVSSMD